MKCFEWTQNGATPHWEFEANLLQTCWRQDLSNNCCSWHPHHVVTMCRIKRCDGLMRSPAWVEKLKSTSAWEYITMFATNIRNVQGTFYNVLERVAKLVHAHPHAALKSHSWCFRAIWNPLFKQECQACTAPCKWPKYVLITPVQDDRTCRISNW